MATVARTDSAVQRQAFGRIGGKGPAGPTRAAVLRSSRTASVRRRWTGHSALTKRRSSLSSQRGGQARPFPTSARRPVVAMHKVRGNKAQGLSEQSRWSVVSARRPVVAGQKVRGNKAQGCSGRTEDPWQQCTRSAVTSARRSGLWLAYSESAV